MTDAPDARDAPCAVNQSRCQRLNPDGGSNLTPITSSARSCSRASFGFAWAGWYSSGGPSPRDAIRSPSARTAVLQESAERTETQMADDIRALKASVEALRAALSQSQMDATALEGLKTRLDAVKSETAASIAEVAGKLEQMQREPEAKFSAAIATRWRILPPILRVVFVGSGRIWRTTPPSRRCRRG